MKILKTCAKCNKLKSPEGFYRVAKTKDGLSYRCRSCTRAAHKVWRAKSRDLLITGRLKRYGLTIESYDAMLTAQGGRCAVCKDEGNKQSRWNRMSVDHDHTTGKVRGLLCDNCNRALGLLRDDPELVDEAAAYLRRAA